MIINTRNFLLYLLSVGFLVLAITATALHSNTKQSASVFLGMATSTEVVYEAEVVTVAPVDRAGKLASFRDKIADLGESVREVVSTEVEPSVLVTEELTAEPTVVLEAPLLCPDYTAFSGSWNTQGVSFSVVEGARLLARDVVLATTTASGTPLTYTEREVVLQLPLRTFSLPVQSCLPTDVVGVAVDGSLIRNNEVSMYTVFGGETLIGYALDGFPIYGQNDTSLTLDTCGGTIVSGQYAYYLDKERGGVLNCFAAIPVSL
jgi:hypothetical protein